MKVLKGLALSLLSFLLFLSLSTFGFALMLKSTALNPDFVTTELDRLDTTSLTRDFVNQQISRGELPPEFGTSLVNAIPRLEPMVKEQVGAAIYDIYDYLLGKDQSLDLALTLRKTILKSDFISSLVDELDIAPLLKELVRQQLTGVPPEMKKYLDESLDDIIAEMKPWIKEQMKVAADPILDYLLGKSQSLKVTIPLEPVKASLKDNLKEAFLKSPPPQLAQMPPAALSQYFDQFYQQQVVPQIPSTFTVNESLLGTEIPREITLGLAEAEQALEQGRQFIDYFQLGYYALIGFMLLLVLGIILIHRQVRGSTRDLGTIFLTYGVFEYAGILVAKHLALPELAQLPIPPPLQLWLLQLTKDFLAPLEMFSLGFLIGGLVLLIVSFVYKPREPSSGTAPI